MLVLDLSTSCFSEYAAIPKCFSFLSGYDFDQTYVIEDEQPARQSNDNRLRLTSKEHDVLPGFGAAKNSDYSMER